MASKTFDVPRIHCGGCEQTVTHAVKNLPGIEKVEASAQTKRVLVEFNPAAVDEAKIREALKAVGYPAN